jgi:hypothetical protein
MNVFFLNIAFCIKGSSLKLLRKGGTNAPKPLSASRYGHLDKSSETP